jgi:hypothetical protein
MPRSLRFWGRPNIAVTRGNLSQGIYGGRVRDDSAEADLFKLIIHDLSTGHVIRQHRETNYAGQFLKAPRKRPVRTSTLTSPFDDDKPYEGASGGQNSMSSVHNASKQRSSPATSNSIQREWIS